MSELREYKTAIITLSDKGAAGLRVDASGPAIRQMLLEDGKYSVEAEYLIGDEKAELTALLIKLADEEEFELILTTGGTGFSPRDCTPEATMAAAERNCPGIAEYMRMQSCAITPRAMLSRGVSVIRGKTLIINLPGSPKAACENLGFLLTALPHGLDILLKRDGECAR